MSTQIDTSLIGKTIKQLRLSRNWTQEDLADRAFYSVRNIRRIENEGTGSIDIVNTFAGIFEVSAMDILNGCSFLTVNKNKTFPTTLFVNLSNSFNNDFRSIALI